MIALLAIALSLASTNDYLWTTGAAPYEVVGIGTGPSMDYTILRGEDPAFLFESFYERRDVAELLSMEDNSTDMPLGLLHPFPPAVPATVDPGATITWFYLSDAGYSYANILMRTNGTPCNALFDSSKTVSRMKRIDSPLMSGSFISTEELTNVYTTGRANFIPRHVNYTYRSVHYGPTNDVYSIRPISSVITNLYLDFDATDALQFSGKRFRASVGTRYRSADRYDYSDWATAYREDGWRYQSGSETQTDATNRAPFETVSPNYGVTFSAVKRTACGYHGQSLGGTVKGSQIISREYWRNPEGTCLVEFHHSLTGHLDEVELFGLFRIRREQSWPVNGISGLQTNVILQTFVIVNLGSVAEIERKENGARRFAFEISMPSLAHSIIQFSGFGYPDDNTVIGRLEYPDPQGPYPGSTGYYMRAEDTSPSTDLLTVTPIEVIGVAKLTWRTRILRQ